MFATPFFKVKSSIKSVSSTNEAQALFRFLLDPAVRRALVRSRIAPSYPINPHGVLLWSLFAGSLP